MERECRQSYRRTASSSCDCRQLQRRNQIYFDRRLCEINLLEDGGRFIILCLVIIFSFGIVFGNPNGKSDNENVKVTVYADGKFRAAMIFIKGVMVKELLRTPDNNEDERSFTKYFYTKAGKIVKIEDWIDGKKLRNDNKEMYEFDLDLVSKYLSSADFLKRKGILIPLPGLIFEQIKDTAMILDAGDNDSNFKKQVSSNEEFKTVKFIGFNKKIQLEPTLLVIGSDQPITDYELTLKNSFLFKEIYKLGSSEDRKMASEEVVREYFYTGNRLIKLVTTSDINGKNGKSDHIVSELKFVYSKLGS